MSVSLSWDVSVSYPSATEATVTVKLKAKSSNGSYNNNSKSGYITIDGTKYTFSHSFGKNTTTILATKSKTVSRTTASRSISLKASYTTGVSSGTITKSGSTTVSARPAYTVTFNGNGGTSSSVTVYYGYTTTFPSLTRTGYTHVNWKNSGGTAYAKGATTPAVTGNITYTAQWTLNTYPVYFNANGGTEGSATQLTRTYNTAMAITSAVTPSRQYYNFLGWATSSTATAAQYTTSYPASTSTSAITLYAVWEMAYTPPKFDVAQFVPKRVNSQGQPDEDGDNALIPVVWTNGKNADQTTAQVTSVTYEYKLSSATAWTTLATHTISSGSSDSLTTTGGLFSTNNMYDIRVTLTDANTSVTSTYIWKVVPAALNQALKFLFGVEVTAEKDIVINIDDNAAPGTIDGDLKAALQALGWYDTVSNGGVLKDTNNNS